MHPRIKELVDYLDRERDYLCTAIASVPAAKTNVKPSAEAWCVDDVVHHLAIMERRIAAVLARGIDEARAAGVAPDAEIEPVLPRITVAHVLDRSKRFRNPNGDPENWMPVDAGLEELDRARADLKALIAPGDLPNLGKVSAPHPLFGQLSGYEWVAFVAAHTHRHADQIREIGGLVGA